MKEKEREGGRKGERVNNKEKEKDRKAGRKGERKRARERIKRARRERERERYLMTLVTITDIYVVRNIWNCKIKMNLNE